MRALLVALALVVSGFFSPAFAAGGYGVSGQVWSGGMIPNDGSYDPEAYECHSGRCFNVQSPTWPIVAKVQNTIPGLPYNQPATATTQVWHTVDVTPFLPAGVQAASIELNIQCVITPDTDTDTNILFVYARKPGATVSNPVGYCITRYPGGARDHMTITVPLDDNKFEIMHQRYLSAVGWAVNFRMNYWIEEQSAPDPCE